MEVQRQFPGVHLVWRGGISFIYKVHPRIVVKVPKSGELEREQFYKGIKIYEIFSRHSHCPSVVQCFCYTGNGIFLEYMRGATLLAVGMDIWQFALGSLYYLINYGFEVYGDRCLTEDPKEHGMPSF